MTPTTEATPSQIHHHHERRARLIRMGIIPAPIAAPELHEEVPEPIPAPEVPPEPIMAAVAAPVPQDEAPKDEAPKDEAPSFEAIVRATCEKHGITKAQLKGANRQYDIIRARHETFYRLYTERGMSLPQIGRMLGGFDHTTVLNGIRRHKGRMNGEIDKRHTIIWTQDVRRTAESMRRSGARYWEIGEAFGVSITAVSAAFSRWKAADCAARKSEYRRQLSERYYMADADRVLVR
jgi:hypothetical protein